MAWVLIVALIVLWLACWPRRAPEPPPRQRAPLPRWRPPDRLWFDV